MLRKMRGRWFLAVIEPHMTRPKKSARVRAVRVKHPALVALPKGAIDQGEKPEQTAIREVSEETGVQANLVAKLADIKYHYVRNWGDRARVFKIVSFYLLLYRSGRLGNICARDADRSAERLLASAGGCPQEIELCGRARSGPARAAISEKPSGTGRSCRRHHTLSATSPPAKLSATSSSACPTV